jgi:hypothetical protein
MKTDQSFISARPNRKHWPELKDGEHVIII